MMRDRAPVLTVWTAVVAEVLGFEHDDALTLGRAVAGLNAYLKGVSLGLFQPTPTEIEEHPRKMCKEETVIIGLLHRAVLARCTDEGLRALSGDSPIRPESVQKYLQGKFGDALEDVSNVMLELAKPLPPLSWPKKPIPCTKNFGLRFLPGRRDGGPPASWTWTSSARWLRLDPGEDLLKLS
jgi:hypothetical protein